MSRLLLIAAIAIAVPGAAPASAQTGPFEIALGASWMNKAPLTTGAANETTPTGTPFQLFTTTTTLGATTAIEIEAGVHVGDRLHLFGAVSTGRRQLTIAVENDVENGAPITATERVEQYMFTGGALWALSESRVAPFVSAEAGQLRQLHEEKTLIETGLVYMAGGGVNVGLTNPSADTVFGLRFHGRAVLRSKQFLINTNRVTPAATVSLFVRF